MKTKDLWAEALERELWRCNYNARQVSTMMGRYEALASQKDQKTACSALLEAYGSCDAAKEVRSIQSELERLNTTRTLETNPIIRLRQHVETLRKNVNKLSVEVDGKPFNGDKVKTTPLPEFARDKGHTFEAVGRNGRKFEVEICI